MTEPILGILGGMGPEATIDLFRRIVAVTPAAKDQDHIHILIENNPKVPDRTAAILDDGESPLPLLLDGASRLEQAGAGCIIIPCNTAHYWLEALREKVTIPIMDMIQETVTQIGKDRPKISTVGLLATSGTIHTDLYQNALRKHGITTLIPSGEDEIAVMAAIRRIKAGDHSAKDTVIAAVKRLRARGAEAIIPGCTELSLVIDRASASCPVFDPLSIIAARAVAWVDEMEDHRG